MVVIRKDFGNHDVSISPFRVDEKERVAYDLHVGECYLEPGKEGGRKMPEQYTLRAGHCIRIAVEEDVTLPRNIFGQVCSKASLASLGLYVANTKIDPQFSGKLKVPVFNASNRSLPIRKGQPFCSIFFQVLEHAVENDAPRRSPDMPYRRENRLRAFLSDHGSQITTVVIAVILSAASAYAATRAALVGAGAEGTVEQRVRLSDANEPNPLE